METYTRDTQFWNTLICLDVCRSAVLPMHGVNAIGIAPPSASNGVQAFPSPGLDPKRAFPAPLNSVHRQLFVIYL